MFKEEMYEAVCSAQFTVWYHIVYTGGWQHDSDQWSRYLENDSLITWQITPEYHKHLTLLLTKLFIC